MLGEIVNRIRGIAAGRHVVAELPPETDEAAAVAAAREGSVGVYGMADYGMADYRFPGSSGPPALVLGYGRLAPKAIEAGVRRLAQELQAAGKTSGC